MGYLFPFPLLRVKQNIMKLLKSLNGKMETLTKTSNPVNETEGSFKKVERVKSFTDYAIQKAGLNNGDATSMKMHLKWIKDGHVVDATYNEKEHEGRKEKIHEEITSKHEEKEKLVSEKKTTLEVHIPSCNQKIDELNEEIHQTKLDLEEKKLQTGYQPIKLSTYGILVGVLSIYLILFYASTIYASFFRNANSLLATAGDDIVLYLDSIFDVKGIFTPSPSLIIVYLGSFLFFAIGLIPHTFEGKRRNLWKTIAIIGALIVDSLLAYKIDSGIYNLKVMAGVAEEDWFFLTSINFYLVLAFGFLAYLVWGYMYELMIREKNKKNAETCAQLVIRELKSKIRSQKDEIKALKEKVIQLESQISMLVGRIENLKKDLEKAVLNPDLLSQCLTSFYMGWRQYLNSSPDFDVKKVECESAYKEFMETHFKQIPNLN